MTAKVRTLISEDWRANPRDYKARFVLVGFRVAQAARRSRSMPRPVSVLVESLYRLATEWVIGIELRPKTEVGGGLSIYHGFGIVVHDHAVIGRNVKLRQHVTIGHARPGGGCPVIEDGVEFGAGSIALGEIRIGTGAIVAAGAVVTHDVPAGSVAIGNPARTRARVNEEASV